MAAPDHETQYEPIKIARGGGYADVFVERRFPKDLPGSADLSSLSIVPRSDNPRMDLLLTVDQLEKLAKMLTDFAAHLRAAQVAESYD